MHTGLASYSCMCCLALCTRPALLRALELAGSMTPTRWQRAHACAVLPSSVHAVACSPDEQEQQKADEGGVLHLQGRASHAS